MNTPNNAAALERLEQKWRESAETERDYYSDALVACANELATLRATLAQPDALTSQPSGGGEPIGYVDRNDLARLHAYKAIIWPGTNEIDAVPVYTHPSADAPGSPAQACKHKWRDSDRADPMMPCAWVQQCTKCGAYEDDN